MSVVDVIWLLFTALLSAVAFLRYRSGYQPKGSLIVAVTMALATAAILFGWDKAAQIIQVAGILIAVCLIAAQERWKRKSK